MNRRSWYIAIVAIIVASGMLLFRAQIAALLWHLRHGNELTWDGHSMTLPLLWTPSSGSDVNVLKVHRAFTSGGEDELSFKNSEMFLGSTDQASKWQAETVESMNSKSTSKPYTAYTVVTDAGDVFCIDSGKGGLTANFVCKLAGSNLGIGFVGKPNHELDARAIVSSLR